MVWKVRDPAGTLRTVVDAKMRDSAGTLRTLVGKIRDGAGTLRTFHTATPAPTGTFITPESTSTSSVTSGSHTASFTVTHPAGAATYVWGATNGVVVSGGTTATASLRVSDPTRDDFPEFASFYCDVTISGVTTRAYCTMEHNHLGAGLQK